MAKILALLLLVGIAHCFTEATVDKCLEFCSVNLGNAQCIYVPELSYIPPNNPACAKDLAKIDLCLAYYGCLDTKDDPDVTVLLNSYVGISKSMLRVLH